MKAVLPGEEILKRYQDAMSSGQTKQRYKDGIAKVTESPMAKAAEPAAMQLYLDRIQESVSTGRRAQALLESPLSRYKDNAINQGSDRLVTGAKKAEAKMRVMLQKWAPLYAEAAAAAAALPKGGESEALARVAAAMRVMKRGAGKSS